MTDKTFGPVVTVSATYGVGGSLLAPRLAEALGIPFIDRFIAADLRDPSVRSQEGLIEGEQQATPAGRFLSYFARAASVGAMVAPDPGVDDDVAIREKAERVFKGVQLGDPALILGRAGAVVLATRPRTFHIRLDGNVKRRTAWAAAHEGLDLESAGRRQNEADRARTAFVKRLYRTDPSDPTLYHLVVDPTVFGIDKTLELLVTAATAFFSVND